MNISKYFELLRFYLSEKMDYLNSSIKNSFSDEIQLLLSSILSALFSYFISNECFQILGICGTLFRIVLLIVLFLFLNFVILKLLRCYKSKKEIGKSNNKDLSSLEVKRLIDQFDNIACDSILLSKEFIERYKDEKLSFPEKQFALIEAFYYYKKSVDITFLVIQNESHCINGINKDNGVSTYRLNNVYKLLNEINDFINQNYENANIIPLDEFMNENLLTAHKLEKIKNFLS